MATRPVRDATAPETPRDPRAAAVALSGLTRLFGLVPAVVRVDLRVERGERILLRGANGAGKTTLLRLVATALRPTYGGGRVLGLELVKDRREIRRRTELLGHRTRLYDDLTAVENLRFTCRLHGLPAAGVEAALATAGLAPVGHERVGGYSQGMRQRVAVARLLLREPDLLLLDEPYAGLDAETRIVLDAELEAAAARGATVVVATHDPAPGFAPDRVLTMEAGRLREGAG